MKMNSIDRDLVKIKIDLKNNAITKNQALMSIDKLLNEKVPNLDKGNKRLGKKAIFDFKKSINNGSFKKNNS